jgi:hypothetical protein
MHELVVIAEAEAKASQVTWVVAAVVTEVTVASAFTVIAHYLTFSGDVEGVVAGNLCLL